MSEQVEILVRRREDLGNHYQCDNCKSEMNITGFTYIDPADSNDPDKTEDGWVIGIICPVCRTPIKCRDQNFYDRVDIN